MADIHGFSARRRTALYTTGTVAHVRVAENLRFGEVERTNGECRHSVPSEIRRRSAQKCSETSRGRGRPP
jgi:hypothetical protein